MRLTKDEITKRVAHVDKMIANASPPISVERACEIAKIHRTTYDYRKKKQAEQAAQNAQPTQEGKTNLPVLHKPPRRTSDELDALYERVKRMVALGETAGGIRGACEAVGMPYSAFFQRQRADNAPVALPTKESAPPPFAPPTPPGAYFRMVLKCDDRMVGRVMRLLASEPNTSVVELVPIVDVQAFNHRKLRRTTNGQEQDQPQG